MKYKTKKFLKYVAIFVAGVLLSAFFAGIGGKSNSIFDKELNEDNLIKVENYVIENEKTDIGLDINVNEDTGVIKFSGIAERDYTAVVAQVELEAGTYTISGFDNSTKGRCYLGVLYDVDQIAMSGSKTQTFTLEQSQTVTVQIVVSKDANFNILTASTFKPCLVSGDKVGSIYAD